jgi:dTDP-4-amino-4,6-dideoxygalactose transaminase
MLALKSHLDDLAIFGGTPAFSHELHVGRPNVGERQNLMRRLNEILDRKWLTNDGPLLQEFEQRISKLISVKHCIAVCNATIGLEILVKANSLSGEVILPSFTFVATAHALRWLGITPVFCDIDPATHNIDPAHVRELITPRTTAIIGVHVWGRPCGVAALSDLAQRHNLKLLFDAAHAFACSHKGRMIGGFGDAEIFSFHATKFVNAFEGGAIATNNDNLAGTLRLMRNFGFSGVDKVSSVGTNGKMSEVSAAMGLTSLDSLETFIEVNRRNYNAYEHQLRNISGISLSRFNEEEKHNYQYVVIEVDESVTGIDRDLLNDIFWAENVITRRYFYPGCHRMEPYLTENPQTGQRLQDTERLTERVLCLPTGSSVDTDQVVAICAVIRLVVNSATALKQRFLKGPVFHHRWRASVDPVTVITPMSVRH